MEIEEQEEPTLEQLINSPADPSHDEVSTPINITWDPPTQSPIQFPKFSAPRQIVVPSSQNNKQNQEQEDNTPYVLAANLNCNASVLASADSTNVITIYDTTTWQVATQIKGMIMNVLDNYFSN